MKLSRLNLSEGVRASGGSITIDFNQDQEGDEVKFFRKDGFSQKKTPVYDITYFYSFIIEKGSGASDSAARKASKRIAAAIKAGAYTSKPPGKTFEEFAADHFLKNYKSSDITVDYIVMPPSSVGFSKRLAQLIEAGIPNATVIPDTFLKAKARKVKAYPGGGQMDHFAGIEQARQDLTSNEAVLTDFFKKKLMKKDQRDGFLAVIQDLLVSLRNQQTQEKGYPEIGQDSITVSNLNQELLDANLQYVDKIIKAQKGSGQKVLGTIAVLQQQIDNLSKETETIRRKYAKAGKAPVQVVKAYKGMQDMLQKHRKLQGMVEKAFDTLAEIDYRKRAGFAAHLHGSRTGHDKEYKAKNIFRGDERFIYNLFKQNPDSPMGDIDNVLVIDDNIGTGSTFNQISDLLPESVKNVAYYAPLKQWDG